MKRIFKILVALCFSFMANAQQIETIDNLQLPSGYGQPLGSQYTDKTGSKSYNGNLYFFYNTSSTDNSLMRSNNDTIVKLLAPVGYKFFTWTFYMNDTVYCFLQNPTTFKLSIGKIVGNNAVLCGHPSATGEFEQEPKVYNGKAYFVYRNITTSVVKHFSFDGTNFTEQIPSNTDAKPIGTYFEYQNNLYTVHKITTTTSSPPIQRHYFAKVKNGIDSLYTNPDMGEGVHVVPGSGVTTVTEYNGKMYFIYKDVTKPRLATFDGTQFLLLPDVTGHTVQSHVRYPFIVHDSVLHLNYFQSFSPTVFAETGAILVADTIQVHASQPRLFYPVLYQNKLIRTTVFGAVSYYEAGAYNSVSLPVGFAQSNLTSEKVVFNNKLYFFAQTTTNPLKYHLMEFNGSTIATVADTSYGIGPFNELVVNGNALTMRYMISEDFDPMDMIASYKFKFAQLYVPCSQPVITDTLANQTYCVGDNDTVFVSHSGTGSSYKWYKDSVLLTNQTSKNLIIDSASAAIAGTYQLIILSACGNDTSNFFTISVNDKPNVVLNSASICEGQSFTFTPSGALNYVYSSGTSSVTPTVTTVYTVTGTDSLGCSNIDTATITVIPSPTVTYVATNVACFGDSTGSLDLTVSGGLSPYSIDWGSGINTEDRTNLPAGSYSVSVTDSNFCASTITATISEPTIVSSSIISQTNVLCYGASTGAVTISAIGGTAPYTYFWSSNGDTTSSVSGLNAGTYICAITDTNGCTNSQSVTITQPAASVSGTTTITNVSCNAGSNGAINLTPSGGVGPYTFLWNDGVTSEDASALTVGNYSVTITDVHDCTATVFSTVTQPSAIVSSVVSQTSVLCNGASNGAATVTASGGTGTLTYAWAPSGGNAATATGLAAGVYTCTITDANSCTKTQSVTITQPIAITSFISSQTNVSCNGYTNGEATVSASGGTGAYTYAWAPYGGTNATASGLAAGSYTCTITDENACVKTQVVVITQPAPLTSSIAITNASCYASSDGALNITVSGGTAPYNYFWNSLIVSEDLISLSAGTYSVQIGDSQGCPLVDTAEVTQPSEILSSTVVTNVDCFGNSTGAINIVPSGGFGPYTYNWGGGITTEDRASLAAGSYNLTITDATSCAKVITTIVTQPSQLDALNTSVDILCYGASTGSIDVTATGGTAPYTYNWGSGITSQDLTNVPAGSYSVTITDNHGCVINLMDTLTQPSNMEFIKDSTNILCFGENSGMAEVSVSGGEAPYSYNWIGTSAFTSTANYLTAGNYSVQITDNNGCIKIAQFELTQNPAITSNFTVAQCDPYTWASNYYPNSGIYQQIFTAANGCDSMVTLNLTIHGYPSLSINVSETAICQGESITLDATGGVTTATWDNGVINNQSFVPSTTTTYTAAIANAQGCVTTGSIEILVRDLPIVFLEEFPDSTCLDANLVACPFATPAGGIYSGPGVIGVLLQTQNAGLGQHEIFYSYTDQHGCTNSDTSIINIVECELPANQTGLTENSSDMLLIYPNPTMGEITIESQIQSQLTLTDAVGKIIQTIDLQIGENSISLTNEANGIYFVIINSNKSIQRIVKQ